MNLLEQFIEAKTELAAAKKKEMDLRKKIVSGLGEKVDVEGTKNYESLGFDIKAVYKINRSIDIAALEAVYESLNDQEKNCLDYRPNLILKDYKNLPTGSKLLECITEKSGTPTLTITQQG